MSKRQFKQSERKVAERWVWWYTPLGVIWGGGRQISVGLRPAWSTQSTKKARQEKEEEEEGEEQVVEEEENYTNISVNRDNKRMVEISEDLGNTNDLFPTSLKPGIHTTDS